MTLSDTLREYIAACFTGLWVQSHEQDDALAKIADLCRQENWQLAVWDVDGGLNVAGRPAEEDGDGGGTDPLAAIRAINSLANPNSSALLVLQNFHRFLQSAEIMQALARQITLGKQNRTFVVILAPLVQIPVELERQFIVIEHDLPGRDQLAEIARGIGTEVVELPDGTSFPVGTGFSDNQRENPPPIGSLITFRYQELSDGGVPRFPSFVGIRRDVEETETPPAAGRAARRKPSRDRAVKQPAKLKPTGETTVKSTQSAARYFEFTGGNSQKFWEISVDGSEVTVRFGRIGTNGQTQTKPFDDEAAAARHAEKQIAAKIRKGYVKVMS